MQWRLAPRYQVRARPSTVCRAVRKLCRFNTGRGRMTSPRAVLYLAQAKSVTGVTIPVDGGQHLSWRTADSEIVE